MGGDAGSVSPLDRETHLTVLFFDKMDGVMKDPPEHGTIPVAQAGILQQGDHLHEIRVSRDHWRRLHGGHEGPFI